MADAAQTLRSKPADAADLIATEAGFRELLESSPDPVVITDASGVIVLVNRQVEATFGFPRQDLIGQPVEILLRDQLRSIHINHRQAYYAAPRTRAMGAGLQLSARRQDGTELPVEISLSPLQIEDKTFVISTVRDVTDRRALEREKDQLLVSLTHMLDGVTDAVFAFDLQGCVVRVNPAACELLDKSPLELIGTGIRDVFRWEDESGRLLEADEYAFHQTLAAAEPVTVRDRFLCKSDGSRVAASVSSALVADKERGVEMVVQLVRDIERERQVDQLKNQVISLVSHELRTPIGHIKGFSSSLLEEDVEFEMAIWKDFVAEIDREADRLTSLVQNLLDMSKIESGAVNLQSAPVHPLAVTRQAMHGVERLTAGHELVCMVDEQLPNILADGAQIERVIQNLIENAVKYSEPGTRVEIEAEPVNGAVEWSVRDHGRGVPIEYRERIFEKFVRVPTGTTRVPGTGLGLPICKGIVEAHGADYG
jgi:PAS domain S-box-containing protein